MKKNLNTVVSENISALKGLRELDTVQLGKRASVSQKTVWNALQPETCNPTVRVLESLASALGVPPAMLLIDRSIERASGLPDPAMLDALERFCRLDPVGQKQVAEFIALWERSQAGK